MSASESDTVLDLKRKVAEQQEISDYAGYRLIYKGKILSDEATIIACSITSAGFVVVMPPKKLPSKPTKPIKPIKPSNSSSISAPPSAVEASVLNSASASVKPTGAVTASLAGAKVPANDTESADKMDVSSPAIESNTAAAAFAPASEPSQATNESALSDPASALVTGPAFEASVKQICEMGFPEDQVKKAMRAAFNNPDRAVDFIFNGIPEAPAAPTAPPSIPAPDAGSLLPTGDAAVNPAGSDSVPPSTGAGLGVTAQGQAQQTRATAPGTPFNMFEPQAGNIPEAAGVPTAGGGQTSGSLDFLRNMPMFTRIRRLVQANPAALPQILQHLESLDPALMTLIDANHAEFTRLINEPLRESEEVSDEAMEHLANAMASSPGQIPDGISEGGQVFVTEEEGQQIARLTDMAQSLGLGQRQVLHTWLACNRDEVLAANFLVDHADELRADEPDDGTDNERPNPEGGAGAGGPPS